MRYASVLVAVLVATAALFSLPAQAGERYLVTPEEIGIGPPPARYTWIPFRCSEGFADNFYHGAWYAGQPTALYRGRAYRPYYRYSALSDQAEADPNSTTPPIRIAQPTTRHAVTRSPRISMPNSAPTIIDISRAGATRLSGAPISMADSTRM